MKHEIETGTNPGSPARPLRTAWAPHGVLTSLDPAIAIALLLLAALLGGTACAATPRVVVLTINDTIQPISEQYLVRGLAVAADEHADAVLLELNTPGGLLTSTRSMVHAILDSPTPVIVYVTPSGSRAGSAGFFLLEASDVAAMAPGTNAGASHPVVEGGTLDPIMKQKLENDTTAFLRSYVSRRQRNVDAAQEAVLNSKSYSDSEALKLNLITLVAPDAATLLNTIDGRTVARFSGATVQLHTRNAQLVSVELTTRERILDWLVDPNVALLCAVLGALLIYLEFNTPGTIIPGALGTLLLLTSLFALNLLPVRLTSVMLLAAAVILLLLEVKAPSHGVLATAGVICLIVGALTLVAGPIPEQRIRLATAAGTGVGFGLITVFLIRIAWRARRNKVLTGADAMIGAIAVAQETFSPWGVPASRGPVSRAQVSRGQVLVHGELWFAEADQPLAPGDHARVTAVRALTLLVERIP
jgi:membrane-bound serine protease (ClpP class)